MRKKRESSLEAVRVAEPPQFRKNSELKKPLHLAPLTTEEGHMLRESIKHIDDRIRMAEVRKRNGARNSVESRDYCDTDILMLESLKQKINILNKL